MKRIFFILLFSVFIFEMSVAQQAIIKVNPLNPILGRYTLGAEVAVSEHSSLSLLISRSRLNFDGFKYTTGNGSEVSGELELTSWGFMPEYRYYFGQQNLKGFYAGAFANYARMSAIVNINGGSENTTGSASTKFNNYGLGLMTGYNFLIKEHFSIDVFAGLGGFYYDINNIKVVYQNEDVVNQDIPIPIAAPLPRIGVNLGYAF